MKKLKAVLLDDDVFMQAVICDLAKESHLVEITKAFLNPKDFLEALPQLDCDLFFVDIYLPEISGFEVAKILDKLGKPFIFITGYLETLKDALDLSPVDILTKPVYPERFNRAIEKAFRQFGISMAKEYVVLSGSDGKLRIKLNDIALIEPDEKDHRHKCLVLNNGNSYTLTRYSFSDLLTLCPGLMQVNKSTLISIQSILKFDFDSVTLKDIPGKWVNKEVTIGYNYAKKFLLQVKEI